MKTIKYILPIILSLLLISCSNDSEENSKNELQGLFKAKEFSNNSHVVEAYTSSGMLFTGYNDITLRILDKASNKYVENAQITWKPLMHMTSMMHSCPYSIVSKKSEFNTLYEGFIVFQMPGNDTEGWSLTIDYTVNGETFKISDDINVLKTDLKNVTVFTGSDEVRYVLAYIKPEEPEVAINELSMGLYKMENMMSFPVVENYKIELDPRMPSMGNHSSPNNEDLHFNSIERCYDGMLSLTMTGYWKLNLKLLNANNELIKGEEVTDTNEASSLYLEIEF
ncbi:hypothetical protein [Namhaeicola litoreus]|uniref:YtkA-like n=1 Tax=Namhaeicola litoreus TaxID=1052145 RepID=A0ABW3Y4G8_9FLAO